MLGGGCPELGAKRDDAASRGERNGLAGSGSGGGPPFGPAFGGPSDWRGNDSGPAAVAAALELDSDVCLLGNSCAINGLNLGDAVGAAPPDMVMVRLT